MKWDTVRQAMRDQDQAPDPVGRDRFWAEFRGRARSQSVGAERPAGGVHLFPRLAWAAAAAVVLFMALHGLWASRQAGGPPELMTAGTSEISQIEVFVPYDSLMIIQDPDSGSALVWITETDVVTNGG